MTLTIISPVEDVSSRLAQLLQQATKLKGDKSIEPPLPVAEFTRESGLPPSDISQKTHFTAVEIASKQSLQEQLAELDPEAANFDGIWNLLDIVQILGDQEQCEPVLLWYLIEDLLDSQSIEGCRSVFDYLESRRERLIAKHFGKKSLVILRACNELLRRLSRAEDAVFCGRVFIFVFQCFPLGDHSSVNRRGDYNKENVTSFDKLSPKDEDAVMTDASDAELNNIESNDMKGADQNMDELYSVFWSLQKCFAYPPSVWDPATFEAFKNGFEVTLDKFKQMKHSLSTANSDDKRGTKRKSDGLEVDEFSNSFNPKYLTSRELFELELNDLAFRRHILVQTLILLQFLLSFTDKSKKKMAARTQSKTSFTLSEDETKWATDMKKAISNTLRVGTEGQAFARAVDTVLARDKNWVRWKEENCPEIARPSVLPDTFSQAAISAKATWSWRRVRPSPFGSLDLKFLIDNEHEDGMDGFLTSNRFSVPAPEALVNKAAEIDLDLEFGPTEEERESLEAAKTGKYWRTLRITSKTKLNQFEKLDTTDNIKILLDDESNAPEETADETQDNALSEDQNTANPSLDTAPNETG